jgi:hypothetical protein
LLWRPKTGTVRNLSRNGTRILTAILIVLPPQAESVAKEPDDKDRGRKYEL